MKNQTPANFWQKYYGSLEGATIIKFHGFPDEADDPMNNFPSFEVKFKDGSISTIEISQDEEGNGGGFIFGLPIPQG